MTRDELLEKQNNELRALLNAHCLQVRELTERHRHQLLAAAMSDDTPQRAIDMVEMIKASLNLTMKINYPQSAEHEDAKWLLKTVDHTLEDIKTRYSK